MERSSHFRRGARHVAVRVRQPLLRRPRPHRRLLDGRRLKPFSLDPNPAQLQTSIYASVGTRTRGLQRDRRRSNEINVGLLREIDVGFDPRHPNSCIRLIWLNLALHLCDFNRDLGPILRPSCAQLFQFGTDTGHRVETPRKLTERQAERRGGSASCGNTNHCGGAD